MTAFADPIQALTAAIYSVLQAAAFTALCPGGVVDSLPQAPTYPLLLVTVTATRPLGGFGTKPGTGTLPEMAIRLHAFSLYGGIAEASAVVAAAIDLLKDAPAVDGYHSWAIFWDSITPLPDEVVIGVAVQEVVAQGRAYIEEAA